MSYYNTTNQTGEVLKSHKEKAQTQNEIIMDVFKKSPGEYLSPTDLWKTAFNKECPLTSVRRSFSHLTKDGLLEKTDHSKYGMYERKEYCWKLAK